MAKAHCIISGLAKGANPFERSCASRRFSSTPFRAFSLSHLECVVAVTARAFGETRCSQQKPKLDSYLALPSSRLGFENASSCTQSDSTRNVWMWGSPSCYSFGDLGATLRPDLATSRSWPIDKYLLCARLQIADRLSGGCPSISGFDKRVAMR